MQIIHNVTRQDVEILPSGLRSVLPERIIQYINKNFAMRSIEEIRLRANKFSACLSCGENLIIPIALERNEILDVLKKMCGGSLYAYSDTINKGYISMPDGVRVGVAGRASLQSGEIIGVYDISSLCIRIPHKIYSVGREICELLERLEYKKGVLIYSPPGVGKTTVLRGVCKLLSSTEGKKRVVVIDSRGELSFDMSDRDMCIDILSGYPRGAGIEIAARVMNPELIVCDEIGDTAEAYELVAAANCGIPFLASAHAGSIDELLSRTGIRLLYEAGVFGAYVRISRAGNMRFAYDAVLHKNTLDSIGREYDI